MNEKKTSSSSHPPPSTTKSPEMEHVKAFRKKRELLYGMNKRKMSLRKNLDNLKENECRLDISQITKCVFLGSLCLKPVPHLFDSPLLLEELDMKVGNVSDISSSGSSIEASFEVQENTTKEVSKRGPKKKNHSVSIKVRKRSIRDKSGCSLLNGVCSEIKKEMLTSESSSPESINLPIFLNNYTNDSDLGIPYQKCEPNEIIFTESINANEPILPEAYSNQNQFENKAPPTPHHPENPYEFNEFDEYNIQDIKVNESAKTISVEPEPDNILPDVKAVDCIPLNYDEIERLKRESTPELILTDSDDDTIDQLMLNIMDIKVGPNVFDEKECFNLQQTEITEYEEYSEDEYTPKEETIKKRIKIKSDKDKNYYRKNPQCKICSKVFPNYIQLKKHRTTHNGDKPYLCLKCNENHTTLDQLIAHLRTHKGQRPYVCKKCNKGFKTTKALENHQPVHVLKKVVPQKKGFKCEVCGKEFRKLCDLERHTRVHTGEKPSVCNICNRRFQQAHNLNKHLVIHTNEKPYQCDICSKKFGRNDVLSRHLLTHSVQKPNHCDVCMKTFIRASQLAAHKEKYHKISS